jgi:hypothetical protein
MLICQDVELLTKELAALDILDVESFINIYFFALVSAKSKVNSIVWRSNNRMIVILVKNCKIRLTFETC